MEFVLTHPDTGTKSILVLFDGVPYEADSDHPWWDEIVDLVLEDDLRVLDLFPIRPGDVRASLDGGSLRNVEHSTAERAGREAVSAEDLAQAIDGAPPERGAPESHDEVERMARERDRGWRAAKGANEGEEKMADERDEALARVERLREALTGLIRWLQMPNDYVRVSAEAALNRARAALVATQGEGEPSPTHVLQLRQGHLSIEEFERGVADTEGALTAEELAEYQRCQDSIVAAHRGPGVLDASAGHSTTERSSGNA